MLRKSTLAAIAFILSCSVAACTGLTVKASYEYPAPAK